MYYVLLNADGTVKRYPYTLDSLIRDNANTSFPPVISPEVAANFNVYPVKPCDPPAYDHTINANSMAVKQGNEWVEEWVVTPATPEEITERNENKRADIRSIRNEKLADSDWTQLSDSPLDLDGKGAWALYRETLRMIPQQAGFPWNVQWPPEPGKN